MAKEKQIIRPGDFVKVLIPKVVERVGYPKSLDDYRKELEENPHFQQAISLMFEIVTGDDQVWHNQGGRKHRSRYRVEAELAYLMAKEDGFGGKERTIHWKELPDLQGAELRVQSLRNAYTGSYYPPSSWHDEDGGGWEPGGLIGQKCHRLVSGNLHRPIFGLAGDAYELPVEHLQLVRECPEAERDWYQNRKRRSA